MKAGDQFTLSCSVESYPPPTYILVQFFYRGGFGARPSRYISYSTHNLCTSRQSTQLHRGEKKSEESDGIDVSVQGPPYIKDDQAIKDIEMLSGENIEIKIPFCSFPPPKSYWVFSIPGLADQKVTLLAGATFGKFTAAIHWDDSEGHCYVATLVIEDVDELDSGKYSL